MPAYDALRFDPPAPVAHVILRHPNTGVVWASVPMLLDSGADITLVPQAVIERLGINDSPVSQYELIGFDGSISFAPAVQIELVWERKVFSGRFLLLDQAYGILGRNILNRLSLTLDGPNLEWHVEMHG